MRTGIARFLSCTVENSQKWVGEDVLPSVFRQRFNLLFVSLFVLSMQLLALPMHAIKVPGIAFPGFEWRIVSCCFGGRSTGLVPDALQACTASVCPASRGVGQYGKCRIAGGPPGLKRSVQSNLEFAGCRQ